MTIGAPESPDLADLIHEMARRNWLLGDSAEAEPLCRQALEMARRVSAKRVEADALITLASWTTMKSEDSISALNEAVVICQAEKLLLQESRAQFNLGVSLSAYGANFRAGREHYIKSAEIDQQMGNLSGELLTLTNAAMCTITLGEFSRVEEMIAHLDEIRDQIVDPGISEQNYQELQADFQEAKGNLEGAAEICRGRFRQAIDSGSDSEIVGTAYLYPLLLLELGAQDEAELVIQHGVKAADQIQSLRVRTRAVQAMVLARKGDFIPARQVYKKAEQIFAERLRAWPGLWLCMAHAHVLAAEKRWDEAFSTFQEAANLLEHAEARFRRSLLLQDWALAHLDRGRPEDIERARELYSEALSEFEDMGSPGYVKRIQARLDELDS